MTVEVKKKWDEGQETVKGRRQRVRYRGGKKEISRRERDGGKKKGKMKEVRIRDRGKAI